VVPRGEARREAGSFFVITYTARTVSVQLVSRNGRDHTSRFCDIAAAICALRVNFATQ
jgi:hypothetical protein